ncbi:carboxypeptidase-like regulatory domain-containing protein [Tautonia rosea]|uniref:carboxypeptidase-like regulatory domain-containing protein n=1 Tax=Tautonia rosea TaxID=2728037 RepID=UPI00147437A3|nr:carboxypeptidase-like regulatory domain-containing protein [Tautonia rosea]
MIRNRVPMRASGRCPIALLTLAACVVIPSVSSASDDAERPAAVVGRVVGPDGEPVADARVWTRVPGSRDEVEARTDADGRFWIGPLAPACPWKEPVFVEADGFAQGYARPLGFSLFAGVEHELGTIRIDRGRVANGRVLDADGCPVAGGPVEILVWLESRGPTSGVAAIRSATETDADGHFRTPPLPTGRLSVQVLVPGFKLGRTFARLAPSPGEEELEPIRLEPDAPIKGVVVDPEGRPIAGASVRTYGNYDAVETDDAGAFTLSGMVHDRFPFQVSKRGYLRMSRSVTRTEDGLSWKEQGPDGEPVEIRPVADLRVVMEPASWIEGRVVDAETGEPVRIETIVLCQVFREADGTPVFRSCFSASFEQPEPGRFVLSYGTPGEYHLAVSADGYHDAEAFTPEVESLRPIEGIVVSMTSKDAPPTPVIEDARIIGRATRNGEPIANGWACLGILSRSNAVNSSVQRGRVVADGFWPSGRSVPIRDGAFELERRNTGRDVYVMIDEPGHAPTIVGPIRLGLGERREIEVEAVAGGSLSGRMVDGADCEYLWVVAFNDLGIVAETRVEPDGSFAFPVLPPGRYGLKAGHDGHADPEVVRVRSLDMPPEDWDAPADPWRNALIADIEPGAETSGVVLPPPGDPVPDPR